MIDFKIFSSIFSRPDRVVLVALYKLKIFRNPRKITLTTYYGKTMQVILPEIVSTIVYITGRFERDVEEIMTKFIKKGSVFVDIGAHIGYFTLLGSMLVGSKGKVYAFEPTPSTFSLLKENCSIYKNIILINNAVFSRKAKLILQDFGVAYSALNSFFPPRINKKITAKKIKVDAIDLDTYFSKIKKPDFIKIDAENTEYEIIRGMEGILRLKNPIICMEYGGSVDTVGNNKKIVDFLQKLAYDIFSFEKGKIKKFIFMENETRYRNLLCMPKSKGILYE